MTEESQDALARAETLIAAAVGLLYPHCGEQVAIGIAQQLVEDYAREETAWRTKAAQMQLSLSTH